MVPESTSKSYSTEESAEERKESPNAGQSTKDTKDKIRQEVRPKLKLYSLTHTGAIWDDI